MERINIMTSCDDGIAEYILPQIASIGVNLSNYDVKFFLVHSRVSAEKVSLIRDYTSYFSNVSFCEIVIEDVSPYESFLLNSGPWPYEAYFSLCCHEYLPADVERVLYIDTADVIIDGEISEYYFGDFEGCSLIATGTAWRGPLSEMRPYNKDDLSNKKSLQTIKDGIFNSGSYVINVKKLREDKLSMDDFLYVANVLQEHFNPDEDRRAFNGDQGLLSVAFVGDIKYFAFPEVKELYYAPYNFCFYYLRNIEKLWYTPKILHYAGFNIRPWHARFSVEEVDKYKFPFNLYGNGAPFDLSGEQIELYEIWWKYCEMTPIYADLNRAANIYASALESFFLPLCKLYNELLDSYN